MSVPSDPMSDFKTFQGIATYFVGHPRLGEALLALKAMGADDYNDAAAKPYVFLEGYGIVISHSVEVQFEKTNPTCVMLVFLGYTIRVCAL